MLRRKGKFSKFGRLPDELQLEIWRLAGLETPYNTEIEEGKLWQSFNRVDGVEIFNRRQNVHVVTYDVMPQSELVATNRRKTHALLRTCHLSRETILKQYKLSPAFGTLVDFDNDVFLFDFTLLGLPLEYIRTKGGPPILHMPELAAKIKNLAIYDIRPPPILPGRYGPGESWFPAGNQQQIKEQFNSLERLIFVTFGAPCRYIPSARDDGCREWERECIRYTEEGLSESRLEDWLHDQDDLEAMRTKWTDLPTSREDAEDPGQASPVFKYGMRVTCLHSKWSRRRVSLESKLLWRVTWEKGFRECGFTRALLHVLWDVLRKRG
ncbi:hypothetical protein BKA61DRAFT_616563 [Leptodontidium sp. MPI-SDFR-AT-0119]|nr:hypothetical protein BKA61DRAFT_616563 [Leptodontidium sp. MPI-SDFR-AT-0119]